MRFNVLKANLAKVTLGAFVLLLVLLGAGSAAAQQQINLTAGPANALLPDGSSVPMWSYSCGASVSGSTATCAALNQGAGGSWSPVLVTVPTGEDLAINLTNNLKFGANGIPTSLVIIGQLGGGLGTSATSTPSPDHTGAQAATTWPIASAGPSGNPPAQGNRVRSFATEVAAGDTTQLVWKAPRPGTYLIESGTHPSIQGTMGLYGILVVTSAPGTSTGTAYPGVSYSADVPLIFSEIDPIQNKAVNTAVNTAGFSETMVWSGLPGGCADPNSATYQQCYPPVVNYTPLYYLINGVAFNKTNPSASLFSVLPVSEVTGNVLVRLVNAGAHMHVPAIVGSQTGTPATTGFSLIAEDGNPLPGIPRVQNEVFLAAGKTYDVMIDAPPSSGTALPVYDRELSLSGGAINRDAGMLAYISVNGATLPAASGLGVAVARPDIYTALVAGQTLAVADPAKGVIANDTNVLGVTLLSQAASGTVTLNANGTFEYVPNSGSTATSDSFSYCANGSAVPVTTANPTGCSSGIIASVTLSPSNIIDGGITCSAGTFNSNIATYLAVKTPGVLANCKDAANLPLTVDTSAVTASGMTIVPDVNGGFTAVAPGAGAYTFSFQAMNTLGTHSAAASVTVVFPQGSNLQVKVLDGADKTTVISDYRWIIEEDRTAYIDPVCAQAQGQTLPAGCPATPINFGTNFHTSFMPVIATGCTGPISCADNQTVLGKAVTPQAKTHPGDVALDDTKRYYISVLPGDAAQPFIAGYSGSPDCTAAGAAKGKCGHGMGGVEIPTVLNGTHSGQSVLVWTEPSPYPPATLSVFVFEDDYPLNGEHDAGGGVDVLSPNEPGLGGFQITLDDSAGGTGDPTGTPTYDMFNMPLSNSLAGTIDPTSKLDACPIAAQVTTASQSGDSSQNGIVGMIVTCPKYESDGKTLSPLAGQAMVKNLYPGRYGVIANPGADRIGRGEEWVQTNTLDGQKAHDSFMRIGEPGYFQEFGPAGYHVTIGFANPKIISDRGKAMCQPVSAGGQGLDCAHEVKGHVTTARMSRTPDERLYGSGNHDAYAFTQCYVSIGDPDGADFGFTKCDANGNFDFPSGSVPAGNWKITTFDQWNDQVVDGITTPVGMCTPGTTTNCKATVDMGEVAVHQWQSNIYTRTFLDTDGSGVSTSDKLGLALVPTNIRFRDGSFSNYNTTDLNGNANFNEVFPLFNWYVVETDSARYKNTGIHVVYDAGGPDDGTSPNGVACSTGTTTKPCGSSVIGANLANTYEPNPLPANLSVPGSVYCDNADCTGFSIANGPTPSSTTNHSTGRIDAPWVDAYGWQGYSGQSNFLEFGKKPFAPGENGGIHGHVVYASTRPFDNPQLQAQNKWEPLVPHVRINLYQVGTAADGITQTLTLVDHTETSSFDDWAQGFRTDGIPNMNCPGQGTNTSTPASDPYFWFTLQGQPQWLDWYNAQHGGSAVTPLPYNSQFKCYDGMHNWNQLQPAPYDGMYKFPSVLGINPTTGNTTGTNCAICVKNTDSTDPFRYNKEDMLPDGKYVVEVVVPQGYELVKEEDKNILIGDNFIAPVTEQFGPLGSIFILPDQAEIAAYYNANNAQNSTDTLGRLPDLSTHEADTHTQEAYWPCVGEERVVPDYISLFPGSNEVAPFAGATRHLCDRKEVSLDDQTAVLTKFYIFTQTHAASHFTGQITDDFAAEFDPFSPAFGEKFAPAYLPVSFKDWAGNEVNRVYADQWGVYNGLNYSTWEVNPPNPTGYAPTMMVSCMNDAGPIPDPNHPGQTMIDPLYQSGYSDFCYELAFMPGETGYFDTPVVPTSAFAGDYNTPDCAYPDATPAIAEVDGDGVGPWVAGLKGSVIAAQVTTPGSGYTSTPSVSFTGGGGTGAAAMAVLSGSVTSVSVSNHGRGYTSTPAVTFTSVSGSGASATANMTGSVSSVRIISGGSYLGTPGITFSAPSAGTRATGSVQTSLIRGTSRRTITGVTIINAGSGYTGTATATISINGSPSAIYTVNMAQSVLNVTLNSGGSGYTSAPTVSFDAAPGNGQTATGSAIESASVVAVNITNAGSGYTSAPAVSITGGSGSGAAATVSFETTGTLAIHALGDQNVDNYEYSGPSATAAPYNQQRVTRHYVFGAAPTDFTKYPALTGGQTYSCNSSSSTAVCPYVTIGGQAMTGVSWSPTTITGFVPSGVPACTLQQQAQYGGSNAQCGQLVVTASNGKQSVDTVTVTVGGKAPTHVAASQTIQSAIDAANPGDLLIIDPTCNAGTGAVSCDVTTGSTIAKNPAVTGTSNSAHAEMLLMWKPLRLQGVGAASSIIDANPHPAGKLDPWRRQVVCLFGLALNGTPIVDPTTGNAGNVYDPSKTFTCNSSMRFSVDRLPLEATVGWDATLNGNLAEQLIEPTIMGAYEGAGITVLSKGVKFPVGSDPFASDIFPTGTLLLTSADCGASNGNNPYPSNFLCNPSSIDGLTVKNSSQGGGGILVHGWGHGLQIANNRVLNNQGTLSGGITIGQGEHPDSFQVGGAATATVPGSCIINTGNAPTNMDLPFCFDMDVSVHNNAVTQNSSLGDELFSSTPAGAGGVTFCNGSDYYKFNYNWVCGNMSTGDGAGFAHIGYSYDGDIEHNTILFNQSTNPTITTNGGGLLVMGAPDQDPPCALLNDNDCLSAPGTISPSDGTGPGLVINANLILGNSADSGSGGGLRLQHINGTDVLNFPKGNVAAQWPSVPGHPAHPAFQLQTPWNAVQVTNNIIANNVAGWDGGGISLQDALATDLINNTVVSNNSTASSGVLFQSLFAPLASTPGVNCTANNGSNSCPQVAGMVSVTNSAVLVANISQLAGGTGSVSCPMNHGANTTNSASNCTKYSVPVLYNDIFWKNRSFMIGVGGLASGMTNQNSQVTLYNSPFGGTIASAAASQGSTGACDDTKASYWDIGVRGDLAPGNHSAGTLAPFYSALTNSGALSEAGGGSNNLLAPTVLVGSIYCDGSRVPVEAVTSGGVPFGAGWQVPPGTNESNGLPAPAFTLSPAATVDEGNNWVNLRWGPLAMNVTNASGNSVFTFDPSPVITSQAVNAVPLASVQGIAAPSSDFYGNPRKQTGNPVDMGAIEVPPPPVPVLSSIAPSSGYRGRNVPVTITGTNLTGASAITVSGNGVTVSGITVVNSTTVTATFAISGNAATGARTVSVTAPGGTSNTVTFTINTPPASTLTSIAPNSGTRGTSVPVTLTGTNLTGTNAITISGNGVTVSGITVVNSTTVKATFSISGNAATGARTVSVTTPGGTSNTVTFTINTPPAPTLTSIDPNSGTHGTRVLVTLTGTNLTGASAITVSGTGVTVSGITVVNSTTVAANVVIGFTATRSTRNVTITTPGGISNIVTFTVN